MKLRRIALPLCLLLATVPLSAQQVIPLYSGPAPGSESWTQTEREYYSTAWGTQVVANVVRPTLTVFPAPADKATGTSVVICPGGGFYALSINSEGNDVAKWLAARGVTAFVLRYRLIKTGADAPSEFGRAMQDGSIDTAMAPIIPLAIADGLAAVAYVRSHAAAFGLSPDRVGLMGFSAGGTIVSAVAHQYTAKSRPAFLASMYAYTRPLPKLAVPSDAPPLFVAAATDDDLGLTSESVDFYTQWLDAKKSAELHIYSAGGHGFGMRTKHLPSDTWIDRFGDWLGLQGFLKNN